jgi:hypothetical protein
MASERIFEFILEKQVKILIKKEVQKKNYIWVFKN